MVYSSFLSIVLLLASTSHAFTINNIPSTTTPSIRISHDSSLSLCSQSRLFRRNTNKNLQMTNDNDSENDEETEIISSVSAELVEETKLDSSKSKSKSQSTNNDNRSALVTALLIGPPLIAKFGIVILVKIATDLVVFPLLFFYRFCNKVKSKIVGLFVKDEQFKGEKINGAN